MQIDAASVDKAIATIQFSRQTHVDWIRWYEQYPADEQKHGETAGTRKHHADFITGYDHVLRVLASIREML